MNINYDGIEPEAGLMTTPFWKISYQNSALSNGAPRQHIVSERQTDRHRARHPTEISRVCERHRVIGLSKPDMLKEAGNSLRAVTQRVYHVLTELRIPEARRVGRHPQG